jgi:hypothetical protein
MADYMKSTPEGDPYLDFSALTRLSEVTVEYFVDRRGEDARAVKRVKFKLNDKHAALVDLGRHLGLFETKRKHDGTIEVATNVREFWVVDELRKIAGANMADYVQYTPDTSILRR